MWGKINNINKWKDMAVGMVAPRSHADDHGSDNDGSDSDGAHHRRRLRRAPSPSVTRDNGASREGKQGAPGGHCDGDAEQRIATLQSRVAVLERENAGVVAQAQQYSMDVKKNHEETVGFYERKLQALEREWSAQLAAERTARKELSAQLEASKNALDVLKAETAGLVEAARSGDHMQENGTRSLAQQQEAAAASPVSAVVTAAGPCTSCGQLSASHAAAQRELSELRKTCSTMEATIQRLNASQEQLRAAAATAQSNIAQQASSMDGALQNAAAQRQELEAQLAATLSALESTRQAAARREDDLRRQCTTLTAELAASIPSGPVQLLAAPQCDMNAVRGALLVMEQTVADAIAQREAAMHAAMEAIRGDAMQRAATWQRKAELCEASLATAVAAAKQSALSATREDAAQLAATKEAAFNATLKDVMDAKGALSVALAEAKEERLAATKQCERMTSERNAAQLALQELQQRTAAQAAELASLQRGQASERAQKSHEQQCIATLRSTNEDLDGECQRMRKLQEQLLQTCIDGLKRVGCTAPVPARGGGVADVLAVVVGELIARNNAVAEADAVQQQWEKTYAQAKDVNQSVSKQLQASQRLVQELRSDVATRERTIASLQSKLQEDSSRWQDAQVNLSAQHQSAQRFETERLQLQEAIAAAIRSKEDIEGQLLQVQNELEAMRTAMQDKDEELSTSQRAASNLQTVLEQFQRGKQREIEEQTLYLNHELEGLRSELAAMESLKQRHANELELTARNHRKEMASKNVAINSLQGKLTEMKRILEETASQLSDEHMIDKRVVSHLVVNFVHSVALQRGDEEDMLKVMSGLLNWDDTMQQKAGLVPGPLNPRRRTATSLGGLVRSVWGGARGAAGGKGVGNVPTTIEGQPRSIAEMWVEFLIKEGGNGEEETHAQGSGGPVPDGTDAH